jgi:hypothetical protein
MGKRRKEGNGGIEIEESLLPSKRQMKNKRTGVLML